MTIEKNLAQVVHMAEDMLKKNSAVPVDKLQALLGEMQALVRVLPTQAEVAPFGGGRAEAVARAEEDAIEAGFDNMPL